MTQRPVHIYGVIAVFDNPGDLIAAARRVREAGYRKLDAYTPYPIHELTEALALPRTRLPIIVFAGGAWDSRRRSACSGSRRRSTTR